METASRLDVRMSAIVQAVAWTVALVGMWLLQMDRPLEAPSDAWMQRVRVRPLEGA